MNRYHPGLINRESPLPLYYQIKELFQERLQNGELKVGDMLEPEHEIANSLNVSRSTIRQAVLELVNEKKLFRVPGKGTFVADRGSVLTRGFPGLTSFTEDVRRSGKKPGARLLSFEVCDSIPEDIARYLNLSSTTKSAVRIRRRMLVDDEIVGYHEVFLPITVWEKIKVAPEDLSNASLYQMMEESGLTLWEATETIKVQKASKDLADHLGIAVYEPVLVMNRIAYSEYSEPLEYALNIYRPDRYTYKIHHRRVNSI